MPAAHHQNGDADITAKFAAQAPSNRAKVAAAGQLPEDIDQLVLKGKSRGSQQDGCALEYLQSGARELQMHPHEVQILPCLSLNFNTKCDMCVANM